MFGCAPSRIVPVKEDLLVSEDEKMIWRESLEEQNTLNASGIILDDALLTDYFGQIVLDLQPAQLPAKMSFKVFVVFNARISKARS